MEDGGKVIQQIIPKIVCLTLEGAEERQLLVAKEFEKVDIGHYEFFPGYSADSEEVRKAYAEGRVKRYPPCFRCGKLDCGKPDCNNILIPAQVAVVLGFQAIFRSLISAGSNIYAICEDDIVFAGYAAELLNSARFQEILQQINLRGNEPVLLRMGRPTYDPNTFHSSTLPGALAVTNNVVMSNYFLVANRAFAEIAYRRLQNIDHTADVIIHDRLATFASCGTINHQLVADRSLCLGEVASLIHPKAKHLEHLQSIGAQHTDQYSLEQQRLQRHRKKALHRDYCIIGSPCCGSHFVSTFLDRNGLQIKHEALGNAGICGWQYTVSDNAYPYISDHAAQSGFFLHFEHLLLYTRNPVQAIPCLIVENKKAPLSYAFRRRHIRNRFGVSLDDYTNPIEQAALAYAYWHLLALERRPEHILHVESMLEDCRIAFPGREFAQDIIAEHDCAAENNYLGYDYPPAPLAAGWIEQLTDPTRQMLQGVSETLGYTLTGISHLAVAKDESYVQ